MNYALIGCGRISRKHINAAIILGLNIVALADLEEINSDSIIDEFSLIGVRVYKDYIQMLNSESLDLVAITTPNETHYYIARELLSRGINAIIEKPVSLSIEQLDDLIELRDISSTKVTVCLQNRFNKAIQKVKETLLTGSLGKLNYISVKVFWFRDRYYYNQADWRGTVKHLDGALLNQSIHSIDIMLWLTNSKIVRVNSLTKNFSHPEIQMEDFGVVIIEFDNGTVGLIEATTAAYPRNLEESLYLFGDYGTIKVGGTSLNLIEEFRILDNNVNVETIKTNFSESPNDIYGNGHIVLYEDMVNAINLDLSPSISLESSRDSLELILSIYDK